MNKKYPWTPSLDPHRGIKYFFMVNYFTLFFLLYGPLLGQVIPKFCPFRSICNGYRDKPALPVLRSSGHYMTLIRASDPNILSVLLYLRQLLKFWSSYPYYQI